MRNPHLLKGFMSNDLSMAFLRKRAGNTPQSMNYKYTLLTTATLRRADAERSIPAVAEALE
jgi:hypothetical protein